MPISSQQSPALMAAFAVDADAARALLPGNELHPVRLPRNRGVLLITVIDYRVTSIGPYIEFSIAIACTHGRRLAPVLLPGLLRRPFGTGQYVWDLPVSSEISVKGGKGIWGMPKHQAHLDFAISSTEVSSQYDLDGKMAMRIELDRPRGRRLPLRTSAVNYCQYRGMLMKSWIYFSSATEVAFGRRASARLHLGDHPAADVVAQLLAVRANERLSEGLVLIAAGPVERRFEHDLFRRIALRPVESRRRLRNAKDIRNAVVADTVARTEIIVRVVIKSTPAKPAGVPIVPFSPRSLFSAESAFASVRAWRESWENSVKMPKLAPRVFWIGPRGIPLMGPMLKLLSCE